MGNVIHTTAEVSADLRYSVLLAEGGPEAYLFVGDLQLCFHGDAATQLAAIARLRESLSDLRDAIDRHASGPLPTADDVLGILAASAGSDPARQG